jgi:hypothetical protein
MRGKLVERMKSVRLLIGTSAVLIALVFAPAAIAQSSSVDTYGGQGGEAAGLAASTSDNDGNGSGSGAASDGGSLPFTGLDIGYLVGGGLLLLAAGAVMARVRPSGHRS